MENTTVNQLMADEAWSWNKKLWKTKAPPKAKNMLWRASTGSYLFNWKEVQHRQDLQLLMPLVPTIEWLKLNVDVALFRSLSRIGLGMIVRNATGNFMAAKIVILDGCLEVKVAKAVGVCEALSLVKENGWASYGDIFCAAI
ncbi:conserved hypothetical protein [Ricinus communis]|uniref:RNase H type-1 domain-containing protein n=1 Tax=Ricinus communis TaxID=3988 RepID=B9SS64_RICCO|nr:conserved hypothetical protein [Ricinus communis]